MKIIDLFKTEEKPKEINYRGFNYVWDDMRENYVIKGYEDTENIYDNENIFFLNGYNLFSVINDEIAIIEEEKEIEKLSDKTRYYFRTQNNGMTKTDREALDSMFDTVYKTIDKIIDELIKLKKSN